MSADNDGVGCYRPVLAANCNTRVHTIWFVGWESGDFFGHVSCQSGKSWEGVYRFRQYTDEGTLDPSLDRKRSYRVCDEVYPGDCSRLVAIVDFIARLTYENFSADIFDKVEVMGTGEQAFAAIKKKPWCALKKRILSWN